MKLTKSLLLLAAFSLASANLYAADSSSGCGLGWEVNGDTSMLGTTTRNTTHATLAPTFSMTFGTSGCARHSIVKNESKGIHYAEGNFASLMVEMSQGQGEVLAGFAEVMGCAKAEAQFGSVMQSHYGEIFTSAKATPSEMYQQVKLKIKADQGLSNSCIL